MTAPIPRRFPTTQWAEPTALPLSEGNRRVSLLIQGESGSGKSHMVCTMPQPIIIGSTDPNLSVATGFARGGHQITLFPLKTWADFQWFVRRTKNREWDAATVALDSYTFVGDRLVLEKMDDPGSTKSDGNLKIQVWNHVKNDQWEAVMDLVSGTSPQPGKPNYHVVVTIHEREEYEKTVVPGGGGEPQFLSKLIAVQPAVPGGLREGFGRMFDCVFISQQQSVTEKQQNGTMKVTGSRRVLWSVPPDQLRTTKDGVGGPKGTGGLNVLPPSVPNTWPSLCEAWGVDPTTMKSLK